MLCIGEKLPQRRVSKTGSINIAQTKRQVVVANVLDGSHPIYPTSVVGHTLGDVLMFLVDEGIIEGKMLDHASGNGVLGIVTLCYDLMVNKKISELFFNDICDAALTHSKQQLDENIPDTPIPVHFTNGDKLEEALGGKGLNFIVSNFYQDGSMESGSNLQFEQTERLQRLLLPGGRMLVKGVSYAPDIEGHFSKILKIERKWEGNCINRHALGTAARVKYLLGVRKGTWA